MFGKWHLLSFYVLISLGKCKKKVDDVRRELVVGF